MPNILVTANVLVTMAALECHTRPLTHFEQRLLQGPRASPACIISAATKLELAIPEHLEVVGGTVDEIEKALGAPG